MRGDKGEVDHHYGTGGIREDNPAGRVVALRQARTIPTAWVSLDEGDSDPPRFWAHLIAALDPHVPGVGAIAPGLAASPESTSLEAALTTLVNRLAEHAGELILILDDYHLVDMKVRPPSPSPATGQEPWPSVHGLMAYLVDHLPANVHIVISARADPPLPLSRLRARSDLVELRAATLRFTSEEAQSFLRLTMGLRLSNAQAEALVSRTEGWIAGLQLAGLAVREHEGAEIDSFIADFAGSDRFVVDYLADEVLRPQPPEVRRFLLATSILSRMCGDLCDAILETEEARPAPGSTGQAMLEALERANLFVVPLDRRRQWYRYHQLFADVLRAYLMRPGALEGNLDAAMLHRRASAWFEASGFAAEAIEHALAAGDVERAADLVERAAHSQFLTPIQLGLRSWLAALPLDVISKRPTLLLAQAWRELQGGDPAAAERLVDQSQALLNEPDRSPSVGSRRAEIAVLRSFLALLEDVPDPASATRAAEQALRGLDRANATFWAMAHISLGAAALVQGRPEASHRAFRIATQVGREAGAPHVVVSAAVGLSAALRLNGQHREAIQAARSGLSWGEQHRQAVAGRIGQLHLLMADLLREQDDNGGARHHADQALAAARLLGLPWLVAYALLCLARVQEAAGDHAGALATLDAATDIAERARADRAYLRGAMGQLLSVLDAARAQVHLAAGDLAAAAAWLESATTASTSELVTGPVAGPLPLAALYECEHAKVAPTQVWLALATVKGSETSLVRAERLVAEHAATAARLGLGWLQIKLAVLAARIEAARGRAQGALAELDDALARGERQGYVRLFADEGPPLIPLLTRLRARHARDGKIQRLAYLDRILVAIGSGHDAPAARQPLPEPLSARELDVLRLVAEGRANPDIARALFIAPSTVKSHINRLFGKLGVTNRVQAVSRGRELGLI
jgi:LuxR family maltose regulon positive regulatory protein